MRQSVLLLIALLLCAWSASAQRTLDYDYSVVSQVRIDFRELGYPPADVIPSGESAIRSLAVAPNGAIYGATSGKRSHLFVLFPVHGYVQPLGFLKDVTTVHHSLVISSQGDVYIGTSNGVDNNGEGYSGYAGGHLLKYTPKDDERKPIRIDAPLEVTDLGIPVPGEGIYCLTIHRNTGFIYGLTYPNGHFFSYDTYGKKFDSHGKVAEKLIPGESFEKEKNIARAVAVSGQYPIASGENGFLYNLNGRLLARAPTAPGREAYNRIDAWAEPAGETLYGGTSDGYLYRYNGGSIQNLGKPLNQYRIRGLVRSPNGKLYGVGGDDDEMARLFSFDPASGAYEILGFIDVNRRPYYAWQAYLIDSMVIGLDGTIYMGQAERKSKLYIYHPEASR